jgi:ankyrin repeat protein
MNMSDQDQFFVACFQGDLEQVKMLFSLNDIDISSHSGFGLRVACINGHYDIVKFLCEIGRVDPTYNNNEALHNALKHGHYEIVYFLLRYPGVKF